MKEVDARGFAAKQCGICNGVDITPIKGRYVRLQIQDAGEDGVARIGDMEIYGSR